MNYERPISIIFVRSKPNKEDKQEKPRKTMPDRSRYESRTAISGFGQSNTGPQTLKQAPTKNPTRMQKNRPNNSERKPTKAKSDAFTYVPNVMAKIGLAVMQSSSSSSSLYAC